MSNITPEAQVELARLGEKYNALMQEYAAYAAQAYGFMDKAQRVSDNLVAKMIIIAYEMDDIIENTGSRAE